MFNWVIGLVWFGLVLQLVVDRKDVAFAWISEFNLILWTSLLGGVLWLNWPLLF